MAVVKLEPGSKIQFTVLDVGLTNVPNQGEKIAFKGMTALDAAAEFHMKRESAERQLTRIGHTYQSIKGVLVEFEKTARQSPTSPTFLNINLVTGSATPAAPLPPAMALPAPVMPPLMVSGAGHNSPITAVDPFYLPPVAQVPQPAPAEPEMDELERWTRYTSGYTVCVDHILDVIVPRMQAKAVPFDATSVAAMVNTLAIGAKDRRLM